MKRSCVVEMLPLTIVIASVGLSATATDVATAAPATAVASASSGNWCKSATEIVLTTCASQCGQDQACAQYPANATTPCSNSTAVGACKTNDASCTYQCLAVYDKPSSNWTLVVGKNTANTSGAISSAPVVRITDFAFPSNVKAIEITGLDTAATTNISKGSTEKLQLEDAIFDNVALLETLSLRDVNLAKLPTDFLPTSISTLLMTNCKLRYFPVDVCKMRNLQTLNLANNLLSELPSADSEIVASLQQQLTTLDLRGNNLTTFPMFVFNMTKLVSLYLDGNAISAVSLGTSGQLGFLQALSADSSLGITAEAGSCASGEREETVLESVVCIQLMDTPTPTATAVAGGRANTLTVVVIALAVGFVLGVIIVGGVWWWRRSQQNAKTEQFYVVAADARENEGGGHSSRPTSSPRPRAGGRGGGSSSTSAPLARFSRPQGGSQQRQQNQQNELACAFPFPSHIRQIPSEDIEFFEVIANSPVSRIMRAKLTGDNGKVHVAVKKLKTASTSSNMSSHAYIQLSKFSHGDILTLIGVSGLSGEIVTEYMDKTDLRTVLQATPPSELTWENGKAAYCLHVCQALVYLHSLSPVVVHGDLKAENVLVDAHKGAKLFNFGRERTIGASTRGMSTMAARWMAPEIILGEDFSAPSDIYAFGVLLTEIDTHEIPFASSTLQELQILIQLSQGSLQPTVSDTCPEIILQLVQDCLQFDPQLRPSALQVLRRVGAWPIAMATPTWALQSPSATSSSDSSSSSQSSTSMMEILDRMCARLAMRTPTSGLESPSAPSSSDSSTGRQRSTSTRPSWPASISDSDDI